ncbi:MAG: hypothetical protein KBE23_07985 [Chloroflexi bacterium]|nr:hypothetical protein [Chloroflexota bacterium]MBP7042670.1 hypothetical protein [Chloroflexota bacterium]
MPDLATQLIQTIPDRDHLAVFAARLRNWLIADLADNAAFTESRAKALLRVTNSVDDATLHDFGRLMEQETAVRLSLHYLLDASNLAENSEVAALAAASAHSDSQNQKSEIQWLSLATAVFAWKSEYPLHQLDPASPPDTYSPAGLVVKQTAHFLRQQVQRSATERDKLGRQLAYTTATSGTPTLDTMPPTGEIPPLPPYFRPPIPVNYPEVARNTVRIDENEQRDVPGTAVTRSAPLTITEDDIHQEPLPNNVTRMPSIRITQDQVTRPTTPTPPPPASRVVTPGGPDSSTNFSDNVRTSFGRKEPMAATKLRVIVQEYPDGPGLYGLQVRVTCKGIKSYVAGTTNREGNFLCELPVRIHSGLTYDVDVTWPREMNNEIERKSVTLNADRTEFRLPFYRTLSSEGKG